MVPKTKFRGTQGSWLISANIPGHAKIKLPSAHKRFLKGMHYRRDDGLMVQVAPGKYKEWREALLKYKMVALTNDEWASELEVKRSGYAWSSPIEGSDKRRFFAVLHVPPIASPGDAVRAAIVAEHGEGNR